MFGEAPYLLNCGSYCHLLCILMRSIIAGYNSDGILIEWDPKQNKFTKLGHYIVVGWDENHGWDIFMDE